MPSKYLVCTDFAYISANILLHVQETKYINMNEWGQLNIHTLLSGGDTLEIVPKVSFILPFMTTV